MKRVAVIFAVFFLGLVLWPKESSAQTCNYGMCSGGCILSRSCAEMNGCGVYPQCYEEQVIINGEWETACRGEVCLQSCPTTYGSRASCASGCNFTPQCCNNSVATSPIYNSANGYCSLSCNGTCKYDAGGGSYQSATCPAMSSTVTLTSPINNAIVDAPSISADTPVTFTWTPASANSKTYTFFLDDITTGFNFTNTYSGGNCVAGNADDFCQTGITGLSLTKTLKNGHKYQWWVTSYNSCGALGGQSLTNAFRIRSACAVEAKVQNLQPYSGTHSPFGASPVNNPPAVLNTLSWSRPLTANNPSYYLVRIYNRGAYTSTTPTRNFSGCNGEDGAAFSSLDYCGKVPATSTGGSVNFNYIADRKYSAWVVPIDCTGIRQPENPTTTTVFNVTNNCVDTDVCATSCNASSKCNNSCGTEISCFAPKTVDNSGIISFASNLGTDEGGALTPNKISNSRWRAQSSALAANGKYILSGESTGFEYWMGERGVLKGLPSSPINPNTINEGVLNTYMPTGSEIVAIRATNKADNGGNGGDLTINGEQNISIGKALIVVVDGNLTINGPIKRTNRDSFLMFIVRGNINISDSLGGSAESPALDGIFLTESQINFGRGGTRLFARGSYIAGQGFVLTRDLGSNDNKTKAAETFIFDPSLVINAPQIIKPGNYSWKEVAP